MPERRSLSDRLKLIRETAGGERDGAPGNPETVHPPAGNGEPPAMPAGWEQIGAYTWKLETFLPGARNEPFALFGSDSGDDGGHEPVPPDRFLFFDTETTGLSGGAGTVIFLAGFGRIVTDGFLLRQYFLSDYPGEREFLEILLSREFRDPAILVTYNGRCFDFPLLRTRLILNDFTPPGIEQYDLLYPSRVCWKRLLPGCSLKDVETGIMGIARKGDIPGYLVPERYFSFLRTGDIGILAEVFSHHSQDIRSLEILARTLSGIWTNPGAAGPAEADPRSLGNLLLRTGRGEGEGVLMRGFREGNLFAGLSLGAYLKRRGRDEEAVAVWEEAVRRFDSSAARLALAKHHEHRTRNLEEALSLTEELIARVGEGVAEGSGGRTSAGPGIPRTSVPAGGLHAGPADRESLNRRKARLLRKMERIARGTG